MWIFPTGLAVGNVDMSHWLGCGKCGYVPLAWLWEMWICPTGLAVRSMDITHLLHLIMSVEQVLKNSSLVWATPPNVLIFLVELRTIPIS